MKKQISLKKEISMTKCCKGCGIVLQNEDDKALGYVPNLEADYCQRCFRIRHYGDVTVVIGNPPIIFMHKDLFLFYYTSGIYFLL